MENDHEERLLKSEGCKTKSKSADEKFLEHYRHIIEKNIGDCDFDVNNFCREMELNRMQLFRKPKALLNQTRSELMRNLKLHYTVQLIRQKFGNIAEITFESGFNNFSCFTKCHKEQNRLLTLEAHKQPG